MEIRTKWNLDLLGNISLAEAKGKNDQFIEKWKNRNDYLEKPEVLKEALDELNEIAESFGTTGDEGYRTSLETFLDQNNPKLKAKYNKIYEIAVEVENEREFFFLNIAKIPSISQKKFLEAPLLQEYRHLLERQFEAAKHLLSEKEEKILNLKSKVAHENWVDMTESLISKEERNGQNFSELLSEISNTDKEKRDSAAKHLNDIFRSHADEAEHEINSILENEKINHKLRNYDRPDKPRHIGDDIETEVVDTLLGTVTSRYEISKKYYELKAKLMGIEKLEYHERNVPTGTADKKYEFKEAVDLVTKALDSLDPEFTALFEEYLKDGKFDVYPKKSKTPGGFAISNLKSQPGYILLNYTKKLNDVTTIAHEMGHAIHHELVNKNQKALNTGISLAIAEVASTFMEDFVIQEILHEADDESKLALYMQQLNSLVSSIQRQVACYKFEQELHTSFRENGYLSKEEIGNLFQKNMGNYMGPFVEQSDGSENWWVYWGHIRRFFYVYSYASGLLISKALQNRVKKNPEFISYIKGFLSQGSSKSPKEAFKEIGIDITSRDFWNRGLDEEEKLLDQTWTLAEKLGKI